MPRPVRGVSLRIEVDDQHPLADGGERGAEIDGGGGLADAALLIGEGEHAGAARAHRAHRVFDLHALGEVPLISKMQDVVRRQAWMQMRR